MSKRSWKTASELLAESKADPEYMRRERKREEARARIEADLDNAEAPLLSDLRKAGYDVESAWMLPTLGKPYPKAIPILLEHLTRPYPDVIRSGIARALAVPEARSAWKELLREYQREKAGSETKDQLADSLAVVADDNVIADVMELVRSSCCGDSRLLLLKALKKSQDPRARATLEDLKNDPALGSEIKRICRGFSTAGIPGSESDSLALQESDHFEEFSTSFDAENLEPFLQRLTGGIESGFGPPEIEQVLDLFRNLEVDEEREINFSIRYAKRDTILKIRIFLDDIDAPDVYFFAERSLRDYIEAEMENFSEEMGI